MAIPNIVADFSTTLAVKVAAGATTATLTSVTDSDGHSLPNGTYSFTIDRNNSSKEFIECTITGTSVSAVKTLDRGTGVATSGFAKTHRRGAEVIVSDFVSIKRIQDILELGYPSATTPSTDYQLATKKYVDDTSFGGVVQVDKIIVAGNAGETVAAGEVVYLKPADGYWWLADADLVATTNGTQLGIAQGAGTATNAITNGVLLYGLDSNQAGGTTGNPGYISNTPGKVSTTVGTLQRVLGQFQSATTFLFDTKYRPDTINYAVDAVGTDAYAITLSPAPAAYYAGQEFNFKAGTANTGACTLNVNGLGAKDIKKDVSSALETGDILQNQVVKVIYDGTNMQMVSMKPQQYTSKFASGQTTKNLADASTTQTIAHGLGTTPSVVRIKAMYSEEISGDNEASDATAETVLSGGSQKSIYQARKWMYSSNGQYALHGSGFVVYGGDVSGGDYQTGVVTVDATNISIAWTKRGAPTGTAYLLWEAQY
jgi:hypothetical protein